MKPLRPALHSLCGPVAATAGSRLPVGSVRIQEVKGKAYFKANTTIGAQRKTLYIGPADDPEAKRKAAAIQEEMHRAKARRLRSAFCVEADACSNPELGRILEVLASAASSQGRGSRPTAAYQYYSPLVGAMLPAASMMTQDVDLATASLALSAEPDDAHLPARVPTTARGPSLEEILRRADPTFDGVPTLTPTAFPSRFRANSGFMVDVLAPVRSRADNGRPFLRCAPPRPPASIWTGSSPARAPPSRCTAQGCWCRRPNRRDTPSQVDCGSTTRGRLRQETEGSGPGQGAHRSLETDGALCGRGRFGRRKAPGPARLARSN